jgi:hypothetical protein
MEEPASFEARAVLAPRRARANRFALLVPAIALVALAWAGLSGPRADHATADVARRTAAPAAPTSTPTAHARTRGRAAQSQPPLEAVGLAVHRLDDLELRGRDGVIAIVGWYTTTEITNCPSSVLQYQQSSYPAIATGDDVLAYCNRTGVMFASSPTIQDSWSGSPGLSAVAVTLTRGIVVPRELESVGTGVTEIVVVGEFKDPPGGCGSAADCLRTLVVDHVAWTSGA